MKRSILILPFLLFLAACDQSEETTNNNAVPTGPNAVTVSPATNCAPTQTAGEIRVTDESQPASVIDRVTGSLFNPTGANVCNWNISRVGNVSASDTCRNLSTAGSYSFRGFIHLNNGQAATSVEGGCTLATPTSAEAGGSFFIFHSTDAFRALVIERGATTEQMLAGD